ncbi:MAG: hypothetical protein K1W17_03070 [Oscillospiraceae bacterium]
MRFRVTASKGTVTFDFEASNRHQAVLLADKFYADRDFEVFHIEEVTEGSEVSDNNEKYECECDFDIE